MDYNFEKLRYRIDLVPIDELVIDKFPELQEHEEFSNPDLDKILRVGIYATDEGSPFVKLEREDYEKRLLRIYDYLKIKDISPITGLALGTDSDYEKIVTKYLMQCDNLAFVMWYNKLRMFHYIGHALRQPPNMKDIVSDMNKRAQLDAQLQVVYNGLLDYESQIFTDIPSRKKLRKQVSKLLQPAEQYAVDKQVI